VAVQWFQQFASLHYDVEKHAVLCWVLLQTLSRRLATAPC